MSLFQNIRRLCLSEKEQIEDILTEIVAEVLRNSQELTLQWLSRLGEVRLEETESIRISTQERFDLLDGHDTDSRVDLVIRLSEPASKRIVFVESKVGSEQESGQLQRYADHLRNTCHIEGATGSLVFITRDFEPAVKPIVEGFDFAFFQTRWFHFYQCLNARRSHDGLERQLKRFMQENNMSLGNQFRSTDLVALEHFLGAKALMDETLTTVSERWRAVLGKGGRIHKAIGQLRMHNRYVIFTKLVGFEVVLGYWLPLANTNDVVWVGIQFLCDPKATERISIIKAFREWSADNPNDWAQEELDNPKALGTIFKGEFLNSFQTNDDHVAAIRTYFIARINELQKFRNRYPKLPWTPTETTDEEE